MEVLRVANHYLTKGALERGWGGPECYAALDISIHVAESTFWIIFCYVTYHYFQLGDHLQRMMSQITKDLNLIQTTSCVRNFEIFMGMFLVALYAQVFYYKMNIHSMINLLQPCHLTLLLEAVALFSDGMTGVLISLLILPVSPGVFLAMLLPETAGLDQPYEVESYWVQHVVIQLIPFYLLIRKRCLATKYAGGFTIIVGIWLILLLHFTFFEIVDLTFAVNVEFFLCPTESMTMIFSSLPWWMSWPSYRSWLTLTVGFISTFPMSYAYILPARLLLRRQQLHTKKV